MASSEEKNVKELPIEQKLKALYDLQQVSTEIDKIRIQRGELPLEVEDLENEIAGLETRVSNLNEEIKKLNGLVVEHKNKIKEAEGQIKKYEGQQNSVRNNREFDAISKEIEYQDLDKQLSEKRIREFTAEIHRKQELLDDAKARIVERTADLEEKKSKLEDIVESTRQQEEELVKKAEEISKSIDARALAAFNRIRSNAHNGLAVVSVQRGACGGCFNHIPPQRQLDIRLHKKLIVCEYCGRILVDDGTQQGIDDGVPALSKREKA